MSRHGKELLLKIFRIWQENPDAGHQVSIPITRTSALPYFEAADVEAKEELHAFLKNAEYAGCIALTWGKHSKAHLLERVALVDGAKLGDFLGMPLASVLTDEAAKILKPEISGRFDWIGGLLDEILDLWRMGKPAHGLRIDQVQDTRELLRALEAVCAGHQEGLDMRTFSARHVGDSKSFERIQSRFARIWQRQFGGDDLGPIELLESLGISKFPHPLLFKGPISILSGGESFNCSNIKPYIGFPPQAIEKIEFAELPSYVLTVENLASFNRHVAEVSDMGLVIYIGGFPSPCKAKVFKILDAVLPKTVDFYHWGDLDLGGLRIIIRLNSFVSRDVTPHLMSREILETFGEASDKLNRNMLIHLGKKYEWIMPIVESMLSFDPPRTLEQENVDPSAPLVGKYLRP